MSVKIGHASIDERGKASGGKAGDQTGKEVCTRAWYKKGWQYCLRPKSATVAERSAAACEAACANNSIGYDQSQRNTLHNLAKANGYNLTAVGKCETDCSAFMTVCAIAGGVTALEHTGNAPTTSTMVSAFKASGAYDVLTADRYLSTDGYLKRGDILVKPGSHTVMVLTNGNCVAPSATTAPSSNGAAATAKLVVDGKIGSATIKALQAKLGTPADGKISGQLSPSKKYFTSFTDSVCSWNGGKSQLVVAIQKMVGATADGLLGKNTAKAWQSYLGVTADGYFGANSAKALQNWLNS